MTGSAGGGTCRTLKFIRSNSVRLAGIVSALLLWAETRWPNIPIGAVFAAVVAILGAAEASHHVEQKATIEALETPPPAESADVPPVLDTR